MSVVAVPDGGYVYKVDTGTGQVISSYGTQNSLEPPAAAGGVSGAYSLLDSDNHLIVGRGRSLDIFGDSVPGDRLSAVDRLHQFKVPD